MNQLMDIDSFSQDQLQALQNQILIRQNKVLQDRVEELEIKQEKTLEIVEQQGKKNEILQHRIDNYDLVNVEGDPQQRFNKMMRKYAVDNGVTFQTAYRDFRQCYNTGFRTNITTMMNNFKDLHGLKTLTIPQYLSMSGNLENAIRIADKMLNPVSPYRKTNNY